MVLGGGRPSCFRVVASSWHPATTQDHNRRQRALRARPALASEGSSPAVSSRTYFESAPAAGDSNRRSGLAITQFAGRVMADTIVAKKAGPDTKVAIAPAQFFSFPHVAAYRPGRVHRARQRTFDLDAGGKKAGNSFAVQ